MDRCLLAQGCACAVVCAGMEPRRCALVTFLLAALTARGGSWGPTCVANSQNDMIRGGDPKNGVYVNGKGVLVRAMLDGLENENTLVVPAADAVGIRRVLRA